MLLLLKVQYFNQYKKKKLLMLLQTSQICSSPKFSLLIIVFLLWVWIPYPETLIPFEISNELILHMKSWHSSEQAGEASRHQLTQAEDLISLTPNSQWESALSSGSGISSGLVSLLIMGGFLVLNQPTHLCNSHSTGNPDCLLLALGSTAI